MATQLDEVSRARLDKMTLQELYREIAIPVTNDLQALKYKYANERITVELRDPGDYDIECDFGPIDKMSVNELVEFLRIPVGYDPLVAIQLSYAFERLREINQGEV